MAWTPGSLSGGRPAASTIPASAHRLLYWFVKSVVDTNRSRTSVNGWFWPKRRADVGRADP
jgi:hypothetical protein